MSKVAKTFDTNPRDLKNSLITTINQIPKGKVANYGSVGKVIGLSGQFVGFMLSGMSQSEWELLPWHRVVNKDGVISSVKLGFKGDLQKKILENEGVVVINNQVDMCIYKFELEKKEENKLQNLS